MTKTWKAGVADEPWKVVVCGRDVYQMDTVLDHLVYVLTQAGSDREKGLAEIRNMTGREIIDALLHHREVSIETVAAALKRC